MMIYVGTLNIKSLTKHSCQCKDSRKQKDIKQ